MQRSPKSLNNAVDLLKTSDLLASSVRTIINEWSKEDGNNNIQLPSHKLYQAQRTVSAITGTLTELVADPASRVIEVACQYWESRALYIAAERRIPDLLAAAGDGGLGIQAIANATKIEQLKLSRVLRCLCSIHIFREVAPEVFANNVTSVVLVNNEPLRAYVMLFNLDLYTASDHLPKYLLGQKGCSYKVDETPFQDAVGTSKARWDWLEEKCPAIEIDRQGSGYPGIPDAKPHINGLTADDLVSRPEHEVFGLAMLGGGLVFGAAHPYGMLMMFDLLSLCLFAKN
jgi:hypothetical protein